MIPTSFDYVRANSVEEALQFLQQANGEGKFIAGGHSLVPLLKFRLTSPETLIDISKIADLKGVKKEGDRLRVGALTTHYQLYTNPLIQEYLPVLAATAKAIGDIQVRNKGTIGGNIAHADPAADLPAVTLALDAELEIIGQDGLESMAIDDFYIAPFITALPEDALLRFVSFPIPPKGAKSTYLKFAHPASGYAVVGVCVLADTDEQGKINYIRVAVNGTADAAYRADAVEQALLGQQPSTDVIEKAASLATEGVDVGSDMFASQAYRTQLTKVYTERALKACLSRK